MVFDEVQADLEAEGYEVQPYVLPAVAVNAPHRRDRIWFVAHRNGIGRNNGFYNGQERQIPHNQERNTAESQSERGERVGGIGSVCGDGVASDTRSLRCGGSAEAPGHDNPIGGRELVSDIGQHGNEVRGETPGCGADATDTNGIRLQGRLHQDRGEREVPRQYASALHTRKGQCDWKNFPTQPPVCGGDDGLPTELDGITFPKWRNESIKAYGNAIVPQVAYQIFKSIEAYEKIILQNA
jgi:DNA (cytosine-5)-methyltransferase 1